MDDEKMMGNQLTRSRMMDMTKGNPTMLLLGFSMPLLLENLFQQLHNLVDSIILGRFVGGVVLAAIIAQAVSAVGCLLYALHHVQFFNIRREDCRPDRGIIRRGMNLGYLSHCKTL